MLGSGRQSQHAFVLRDHRLHQVGLMKTLNITFGLAVATIGAFLAWHAYQTRCIVYGQVCAVTHCSPICQDNLLPILKRQ